MQILYYTFKCYKFTTMVFIKEISTLEFYYNIFNLRMYFGASRTIESFKGEEDKDET